MADKLMLPTAKSWGELWDVVRDFRNRTDAAARNGRQSKFLHTPVYWGKLDGSMSVGGGPVVVSIYIGCPLSDSGRDLTCYPPPLLTGDPLPAGTWVKIEWITGCWYVTGAEC